MQLKNGLNHNMAHKKRLFLNSITSLILQIITILCGFILPRFFLESYGSEVNGMVSSISQFLSFISFMQLGVGAVVQSSWYGPLAKNDIVMISKIYKSAEKFFKKIAIIFVFYTIFLCGILPNILDENFSYIYISSTVFAIAVSLFIQYYFGLTNQLLLNADQRAYVSVVMQIILVVANTICCIFMMKSGATVQSVKLVSSVIYAINPLFLTIYVKKHYEIQKDVIVQEDPIKQKWNGFAQHLASVVMDNTDVMILTIFSTLSNVSIYYVYHLVVNGIKQLITSLTVGVQSFLGNLVVFDNKEKLNKEFDRIQFFFHFIITFLYSCVAILICSFVKVYTLGINDANYNVPYFAYLISLAFAIYCFRIPYYSLIKAFGHYKQTQTSAFIEMILNLTLSILLVRKIGITGVAIGTIVASLYRTIYFVWYTNYNFLNGTIAKFSKLMISNVLIFCFTFLATKNLHMKNITYISWIHISIITMAVCLIISIFVYGIIHNKEIKQILINKKLY